MAGGLTGILFAFVGAMSWSLSAVIQKRAWREPGITASHLVFFSATLNAICLWVLVGLIALWQGLPTINPLGILFFALGGIGGTALSRTLLAHSVKRVGATRSSTTKVGSAVVSLILAWIFLGEVVNLPTGLGIALVLGGVLLLLTEQIQAEDEAAAAAEPRLAPAGAAARPSPTRYLWGLAAATGFAISDNLRKVGLLYLPSAAFGAATGATIGSLTVILSTAVSGRLRSIWGLPRRTLIICLYLGLATSVATLSTFAALLRAQVAIVSTILALEPLTTMLFSSFLLRRVERLTLRVFLAACMVIVGAAVITLRRI